MKSVRHDFARLYPLGLPLPSGIGAKLRVKTHWERASVPSPSKLLAVGLSLEDVIRCTTANPARALGKTDLLGTIAVGLEADLSVLDVVHGDWEFSDSGGARFKGTQVIVPVVTIRAGEVIAPDWGPHPWGWLPAPGPRGQG